MQSFTEGQAVEILIEGEWVGPFTVTTHTGRTADHLVLSGPSGLFEHYNDAPYNTRPVAEAAPAEATTEPARGEAVMQVTRTTNDNGTYRYEIDGELHTKASKVLYTHVSVWTVGGVGREFVTFHKTAATAAKAPGSPRNGWVKTGVIEIAVKAPEGYVTTPPHIDGDPAPKAATETPAAEVLAPAEDITAGDTVTVEHTRGQATPTPVTETVAGTVYRDDEGTLRVENVNLTRDARGYFPRGVVLISHTRKAPQAPAPKAPRKGTKVRTVASYEGIYAGRIGKVDGTNRGDDGNLYVDVDFGGFTWPFLAGELERVPAKGKAPAKTPAAELETPAEEVTAEDIELARAATFAMFATPAPEAPARPAAPGYRRGTAVEYRAPGQGTWRPAVVESVRASDNAVMVRRPNGTRDAAPARDVRLAPAEAATYLARRRHLAR